MTLADVEAAYEEQCACIEGCGGRIILMAPCAGRLREGPEDYPEGVWPHPRQAREPVIVHWLGEMFDPALAGYWGSADRDRQVETLLAIVNEYAAKIDGVKISLLDQAREIAMRRRFPKGVRMYTGDDFDYPTTIGGDAHGYSDALLGIFDVIAPAASAALHALDRGDRGEFDRVLAPTLTLSRHLFGAPTRFYKTGVVFAAWLNGHQSHFRMVGGLESARSVVHLSEQFRLMDAAGLLRDPELAAGRLRRLSPWPGSSNGSRSPVTLAPDRHFKADLRAIRFTLWDHLGAERLFALPRYRHLSREECDAVIDQAYRFATEVTGPLNSRADRAGCRLEGGRVVTPPGSRTRGGSWPRWG